MSVKRYSSSRVLGIRSVRSASMLRWCMVLRLCGRAGTGGQGRGSG